MTTGGGLRPGTTIRPPVQRSARPRIAPLADANHRCGGIDGTHVPSGGTIVRPAGPLDRQADRRQDISSDLVKGGVAVIAACGLFQLTYLPALLVLGPLVAKQSLGGAAAWGTILAV